MKNIILFGKPGAGKGTQAEYIKNKYHLIHISTGDVFRYNIKEKTSLGELAKSYMDKGNLVPDAVTIDMLKAEVEKHLDANGFIFDGFPRTTSQAEALDSFLEKRDLRIHATLALEADDKNLTERLMERGKSSGRIDDRDISKIQNRFEEYNQKTSPLISFYKAQNKFYKIDGIGDIEEVATRIERIMDSL